MSYLRKNLLFICFPLDTKAHLRIIFFFGTFPVSFYESACLSQSRKVSNPESLYENCHPEERSEQPVPNSLDHLGKESRFYSVLRFFPDRSGQAASLRMSNCGFQTTAEDWKTEKVM